MLFVEASAIADDERITDAVRALAAALSGAWPSADGLSDSMASVDACLHASAVVDAAQVVPAAIDELERVIATAYRPSEGLIDTATRRHADGAGHGRAASAL